MFSALWALLDGHRHDRTTVVVKVGPHQIHAARREEQPHGLGIPCAIALEKSTPVGLKARLGSHEEVADAGGCVRGHDVEGAGRTRSISAFARAALNRSRLRRDLPPGFLVALGVAAAIF